MSRSRAQPGSALTFREQQVALMLAHGATNREVAERLRTSVKTVDTHRGHALKKLMIRNNAELAVHYERAAVVEYLRSVDLHDAATVIEKGAHVPIVDSASLAEVTAP